MTDLSTLICARTGAQAATKLEQVQSLWSGYGSIDRYALSFRSDGADFESEEDERDDSIKGMRFGRPDSVIVKHVSLPENLRHPRGWNTQRSHERKMRSYQVESAWYRHFSAACFEDCRVPHCYGLEASAGEYLMVLEDLDASGFSVRKEEASEDDMARCLSWLAHFHARFMRTQNGAQENEGADAHLDSLWEEGAYWHLATRPDELEALSDEALKKAAPAIEAKLQQSPFQTLIHGDAKLANFCFSPEGAVAAVDFQYVGGGCGMKDVAYFIGSCLNDEDCADYEQSLLDHYFERLKSALLDARPDIDVEALEQSWRPLFAFAWADFHRFLKGWSPGHWKLHSYSEAQTRKVLASL